MGLKRLDFGDLSWTGNGEGGRPVLVGVEYKKLGDILGCMHDGRLAGHQLVGMRGLYEECYLVVEEGAIKESPSTGELMVARGAGWVQAGHSRRGVMWREYEHYLTSLETLGGMKLRRTRGTWETVSTLKALYTWWTAKDWEAHGTLKVIYQPQGPVVAMRKPTPLERFAAILTGIGWERARAVARHFKSIREAVNAGEKEWAEIEGIGKGIAGKVQRDLSAGEGGGSRPPRSS